jgi:branched-chain amino acid transport system permease protein
MTMTQRSVALFAGLFVLFAVIGFFLGAANITLLLVQSFAFALIALGLNIQWGYGGLFNFGIMGMMMLGGAAVSFVSYPINAAFWGSEGPMMLGKALLAFLAGGVLVWAAHHAERFGIRGRWKTVVTIIAWMVAYGIYRSQIDPAAAYIESAGGGWVGGLGLHPVLGWIFGGVLAAGVAYLVGKISLGLRTDYLAIATIGISEIIRALLKNMDWLTRGTLTVSPVPWPTPLPQDLQAQGVSIADSFIYARLGFLALVLVILVLAFFLVQRA